MKPRWHWYLGVGAVSGLLSAATVAFLHLGELSAPKLFGYCFGMLMSGRCDGVEASTYLFPGAIFGILFGATLLCDRRFPFSRVCAFAGASWVANALAVFLCVWLTDALEDALNVDFLPLPMAIAGASAGAAGGAVLGFSAKALFSGFDLHRSLIAASALGLLVPLVLVWEVAGFFVFYAIWQAGYAVALAASLPAKA